MEAAKREGLKLIPAWVRECADEEALTELVLGNAQGKLTPLERGKHGLAATTRYGANGGLSIAQYAERTTGKETETRHQIWAYQVFKKSGHMSGLDDYFRHLAEIVVEYTHIRTLRINLVGSADGLTLPCVLGMVGRLAAGGMAGASPEGPSDHLLYFRGRRPIAER